MTPERCPIVRAHGRHRWVTGEVVSAAEVAAVVRLCDGAPTHPTPDRVLSHTPNNPGGTRGN
jgi:hypothetical protein